MQVPGGGSRRRMVALRAASVSSVSICREIAYPTTLRLQASRMAARYTKPRAMRMKVMSAFFFVWFFWFVFVVLVWVFCVVFFLVVCFVVLFFWFVVLVGFFFFF